MRALLALLNGRLSAQAGFTMIELLVAASVLTIGVLGMAMSFSTSQKLSLVSERHATMAHVAQKEIERLEGIPYANVGMSSAPGPHSTDPSNPDYYLQGGSPPTFQWDRTNGSTETVDVPGDGSGQIAPVQTWQQGSLSGQIYDFVTWITDSKCGTGCPSTNDYKRVTVAVTMGGGLQPYPVFVSSTMADPQAMPAGGCSNGDCSNPLGDPSTYCKNSGGSTVLCTSPIDQGNGNTWFLHDCLATASSCAPATADGTLHDTVNKLTGLTCSAAGDPGCPVPDLMDTNPPAPPAGDGSGSPICPATGNPLCSYSSDIPSGCSGTSCNPPPNGCDNTCGGLTLLPTCTTINCVTGGTACSGSGCFVSGPPTPCVGTSCSSGSTGGGTGSATDCNNGAFGTTLVNAESHMWVTSPLTSSITLNGEGALSMFTSTYGATNAVVSFCVEVYDVPANSGSTFPDLLKTPPTDLGGAGYVAATDSGTGGNWPTASSQLNYIFNFRGSNGAVTVPSGHRIGFRVWMKSTFDNAIQIGLDNPAFPAQLQLNSQ